MNEFLHVTSINRRIAFHQAVRQAYNVASRNSSTTLEACIAFNRSISIIVRTLSTFRNRLKTFCFRSAYPRPTKVYSRNTKEWSIQCFMRARSYRYRTPTSNQSVACLDYRAHPPGPSRPPCVDPGVAVDGWGRPYGFPPNIAVFSTIFWISNLTVNDLHLHANCMLEAVEILWCVVCWWYFKFCCIIIIVIISSML